MEEAWGGNRRLSASVGSAVSSQWMLWFGDAKRSRETGSYWS